MKNIIVIVIALGLFTACDKVENNQLSNLNTPENKSNNHADNHEEKIDIMTLEKRVEESFAHYIGLQSESALKTFSSVNVYNRDSINQTIQLLRLNLIMTEQRYQEDFKSDIDNMTSDYIQGVCRNTYVRFVTAVRDLISTLEEASRSV